MSDTGYGDFEFERRFWARDVPAELLDAAPALIVQSYVLADAGFAIRVRVQATVDGLALEPGLDELTILERYADQMDFCAITVKGPMNEGTRYEAERELDVSVGLELVRRGGARVAKTRHSVWLGDDGWVVDTFAGGNAPLVVAEVERGGPVTDLTIPDFCVTELTSDPRFSNDALAGAPYGTWAAAYEAELASVGPRFLQSLGPNPPPGGVRAGLAHPAPVPTFERAVDVQVGVEESSFARTSARACSRPSVNVLSPSASAWIASRRSVSRRRTASC